MARVTAEQKRLKLDAFLATERERLNNENNAAIQANLDAQALQERKAAAWDRVVEMIDDYSQSLPLRELYADTYNLVVYLRQDMEAQP